jgi:hypothetical protein
MEEPIVQNQAVDPQARETETVLILVLALSCSPYRLRALAGRSAPARAPRSLGHHRSLALWHHSRWSHAFTALRLSPAPRASSPPRKTLDVIELPPFWKVEEYLVFALVLRELRARLVFDCLISVSVSCLLFLVALGSFRVPLPLFALVLLVFAYLCVTLVLAVIGLVSDERIVCISRTYLVRAFFFTPQFALWSTPFDNTLSPLTWILCTRNVNHAGTCTKARESHSERSHQV